MSAIDLDARRQKLAEMRAAREQRASTVFGTTAAAVAHAAATAAPAAPTAATAAPPPADAAAPSTAAPAAAAAPSPPRPLEKCTNVAPISHAPVGRETFEKAAGPDAAAVPTADDATPARDAAAAERDPANETTPSRAAAAGSSAPAPTAHASRRALAAALMRPLAPPPGSAALAFGGATPGGGGGGGGAANNSNVSFVSSAAVAAASAALDGSGNGGGLTAGGAASLAAFLTHASVVVDRALQASAGTAMSLENALGLQSGEAGQVLVARLAAFGASEVVGSRGAAARVVTAVAFQPTNNDYFAAAYAAPPTGDDDGAFASREAREGSAAGLVLLWSVRAPQHPALEFRCGAEVTALAFSPFHPHLLLAGTSLGQVVQWDLRRGAQPARVSFPSFEGQSAAICTAVVVGNSNHSTLLTTSRDGRLCCWDVTQPTFPAASFDVTGGPKQGIVVNASAVPRSGSTKFYVGAADGALFRGVRSGTSSGAIEARRLEGGHTSAVTAVECHPRFTKLLLSASIDGTCRLTYDKEGGGSAGGAAGGGGGSSAATPSALGGGGAFSASGVAGAGGKHGGSAGVCLDEFSDFVYDARWSPVHPAVFAAADGSGTVSIWNIRHSLTSPVATVRIGDDAKSGAGSGNASGAAGSSGAGSGAAGSGGAGAGAATCLAWSADGVHLLCGGSHGRTTLLCVAETLSACTAADGNAVSDLLGSLFGDTLHGDLENGGVSDAAETSRR